MAQDILKELLLGIGRFFINPALYIAIIVSIVLGYVRVKRERRFFHIRIVYGWQELKSIMKIDVVAAIIISAISLAVGLTIPPDMLIIVSALSIVFMIIYNFHLLSPAVIWPVAFGIGAWMFYSDIHLSLWKFSLSGFSVQTYVTTTTAIIIGLLLLLEGLLINNNGTFFASPIVEKTNRGLKSIAYFSKKLWVLPIFLVVPGNGIEMIYGWWPTFTLGSLTFTVVLFPAIIGFQQITRKKLSVYFYPKLGSSVMMLGALVLVCGAVSYFYLIAGLVAIGIAFLGRIAISVRYLLREKKDFYAVAPSKEGAVIAAVLPGSPAEKMGLKIGEIIKRVNGQEVFNSKELYEALQINAAHCRLEVLDEKMELRLAQCVVHNNDHHQIGLLLIQ